MPDTNSPIKLAVVIPGWSPMRHLLFESVAKHPDIRLKVFYEQKNIDHRPTWEIPAQTAYEWEVVNSYHPQFLTRFRLIPFRLPLLLGEYQPDVVVVVCLAEAMMALPSIFSEKRKLIIWTGETAHILSRRSFPKITKGIHRILYPFFNGFGCYCKATKDFMDKGFGIANKKLFTIPQCIDNRHFTQWAYRRDPNRTKGKSVFLSVGRLVQGKGIRRLIHAWSRLPATIRDNSALCIAGTGLLEKEIKNLAAQHPESEIRFPGFVDYDDLPRLYQDAHVFILPSREETWGFVVNEAMASGLPVLCSTCTNASQMIVPGKNGYLFEPFSPSQISKALIHMVEKQAYWQAMGVSGQKMVVENYSAKTAADKMVRGIKKICGK